MRPEKGFWLLLSFILLASCEKKIALFEEPQPESIKNQKHFPGKLAGTYLSLKDSSRLQVSARTLVRFFDINGKIHPNQLDSTEVFKDGMLVDLETEERYTAKIEGDSIRISRQAIDTIFNIASQDILRKYKGHYLLNINYDDGKWDVMDLRYQKGKIILRHISDKADIEKLKPIIEIQEDSTLIFKPTRKQFKTFMKQNGFNAEEQFVRIH